MGRTLDRAVSTPFMESAANLNIVINGGMEVSQELGTTQTTLATGVAKYAVDMWQAMYTHAAATAVFKTQQLAPANSPAFGLGFPMSLQLIATTLSAMAGAGDFAFFQGPIEGYRVAKLGFGSATNPQYFTIGFWVCATITGTATVSVRNAANNRSYLANFTVNAANTWEYKTVTIPVDTTGTWLTTSGSGILLGFCFGAGSTFQGTNNAWQAGNFLGTSSTTNFFASNNNNVNITGVGVWPGTDAPTAARSPFGQRPFPEELTLCMRHYQKSFEYATAPAQNLGIFNGTEVCVTASAGAGSGAAKAMFSPPMRTAPTMITYNTSAANANWWDSTASASRAVAVSEITTRGVRLTVNAVTTAAAQHFIQWTADARL